MDIKIDTRMRYFLNPQQLNSVLLVCLVETGAIIQMNILLLDTSLHSPPQLLLLFSKTEVQTSKNYIILMVFGICLLNMLSSTES